MFVSLSGCLEKANQRRATERFQAPFARGAMTEVNRLHVGFKRNPNMAAYLHLHMSPPASSLVTLQLN